MNNEEIGALIRQELIPFMARFEVDNRGGTRIGLEFIEGLGMILHSKIFDIVQKALKLQVTEEEDESKKIAGK